MVWVLPAVVAVVAMWVLRGPLGRAAHRTVAGRTAAGYLIGVGSWFLALPFAAGVDSDALAVLLGVAGGPGAVLLALGLAVLVYRARVGERTITGSATAPTVTYASMGLTYGPANESPWR